MTDPLDLSGYSFAELRRLGYVRSRPDLMRKQRELDFPKPVKISARQALFLKSEVDEWMRGRIALRDAAARETRNPASAEER